MQLNILLDRPLVIGQLVMFRLEENRIHALALKEQIVAQANPTVLIPLK